LLECCVIIKYAKFGQLILRKIIKIVATSCQILRINAPNRLSAGATPQTSLGAYSAPPPLAEFYGPTSKAGEGREERGGERRGKEE